LNLFRDSIEKANTPGPIRCKINEKANSEDAGFYSIIPGLKERMGMRPVWKQLITKYPELGQCRDDIEQAFFRLKETYQNGGKTLICGNGGSSSDGEHIVGELMKGFMSPRLLGAEERGRFTSLYPEDGEYIADRLQGALPAISLSSHTAFLTAYANDVSADMIFAQQVYGYGRRGDTLIGISTSGNSRNVVLAVKTAKAMGLSAIGLTGKSGGMLKSLCDVTICVPWERTPDIQERHLPIYHALCIMLEEEFFPCRTETC
jgi:D-sedoheptulose 7-phosphate isomerase